MARCTLDLTYFNLGVRSAKTSMELGLMQNKRQYKPNPLVLDDSLKFLSELEKSFEIDDMLGNWDTRYQYSKVLGGTEISRENVKETISLIHRLKLNQDVSNEEVDNTQNFLRKISDECLSRGNQRHRVKCY
ncbi:MAG: hypothetical protein PVJ67_06340 [Candidatus Pacearchaeota archaeon]|jgi:hypothetical protein